MANDSIRKNKQAAAKVNLRAGPNWLLFGLALLGMALSGYLTFSAWQGSRVAFCTQGAGCDVVLNSRWSTLFGMPTSFWGFLTYALLAAVGLEQKRRRPVALGLGDCAVRFALQPLPDIRCFF